MLVLRKWCSEIFISIVISLLALSSATVFVLFFRPMYYLCVKPFHITQSSGFTTQVILENYNALIRYFNPFTKEPLAFPAFGQSAHGIQHFAEVKHIFNVLFMLIPICLLILIIYIARKNVTDKHYLKIAAITLILIPLIAGTGFILNFDATFTIFHKIFFHNDYWLFNPDTDPIIKILPKEFFLLCGIVIILIQLLLSGLCYLRYRNSLLGKNTDFSQKN